MSQPWPQYDIDMISFIVKVSVKESNLTVCLCTNVLSYCFTSTHHQISNEKYVNYLLQVFIMMELASMVVSYIILHIWGSATNC